MKKILLTILILIISINLFSCNSNKSEYVFNYELKENYSEKISEGIAGAFIDFTKDMVNIYETEYQNIKDRDASNAVNILETSRYMKDVIETYKTFSVLNEYEEKIISIMEAQRRNINDLGHLKVSYATYKTNIELGNETEYTEEYFNNKIEELKTEFKNTLESVSTYLN